MSRSKIWGMPFPDPMAGPLREDFKDFFKRQAKKKLAKEEKKVKGGS